MKKLAKTGASEGRHWEKNWSRGREKGDRGLRNWRGGNEGLEAENEVFDSQSGTGHQEKQLDVA